MKVWLGIAGGVVVLLLLVAELLAVPVATRFASAAFEPCLPHDRLEVTDVERPLAPRLLVGRVGDVGLEAEGVQVGDLRLDHVDATVPDARLPWARGAGAATEIVLDVEVTEADLQAWLRTLVPLGVPLTVDLAPEGASLGVERLPGEVSLRLIVTDGVLTLQPAEGAGWWRSLGLATTLPLPDDVQVTRATVGDGALRSTLTVLAAPELSDAGVCEPWDL